MSFKDFLHEDFICDCHFSATTELVLEMAFQQNAFKDLPDNDDKRIAYMQKLWTEFNEKKFGGKMKMPYIRFLKNQKIEGFRRRGQWSAQRREIAINRRCFAKYELLYEVFLHEMCHQAVSEIDGVRDRSNGGHGPNWISWMMKVGLDPNRYDRNDVTDYMTDDEKEAHETKIANKEKILSNKKLQSTRMPYPQRNTPAKYYDPKQDKWYLGMIIDKNDQGGKRWIFVTVDYMNGWKIIPNDWFYNVTDAERKEIEKISDYRLKEPVEEKQRRQDRRDQRKDWRSTFGGLF